MYSCWVEVIVYSFFFFYYKPFPFHPIVIHAFVDRHFSCKLHNTNNLQLFECVYDSYDIFLIHTCWFSSEDIGSSTTVIWITVMMVVCAFLSFNFWAPIASYGLFQDYFQKIFIYIHMKKESHIQ